jgi:predicted alpha/beta-fold hydrolase
LHGLGLSLGGNVLGNTLGFQGNNTKLKSAALIMTPSKIMDN